MDNSVYITLSRQLALFRDMDTTANNIANMNTTGYTANHTLFQAHMVQDGKRGGMDFSNDVSTYRNTTVGGMQVTGNTLDVAIGGEGYFTVQTPLGTRYTRAGNFQLDGNGTLVTQEGYAVLDNGGQPITFTETDKNIVIGSIGNISVDGDERTQLGIVTFANAQNLQRRGDRMFETADAPAPSPNPKVVQGVLENSNVQPVLEMTHMIEISRQVGSTAKFIEVMYELQRKSTTTWTQQG